MSNKESKAIAAEKRLWTNQRCEMWKEAIRSEHKYVVYEIQIYLNYHRRRTLWLEMYGKQKMLEEQRTLVQAVKQDQATKKQKHEFAKTLAKFRAVRLAPLSFSKTVDPPIDPNDELQVKLLLYDGVSKEGKGRDAYLSARRRLSPTKRFNRPITSSQGNYFIHCLTWNHTQKLDGFLRMYSRFVHSLGIKLSLPPFLIMAEIACKFIIYHNCTRHIYLSLFLLLSL